MTLTYSRDTYPGGEVEVFARAFRIENTGGAWQEEPTFSTFLSGHGDDDGGDGAASQHVFVGKGGYAGSVVVTDRADGTLHGFIIEGELAVAPVPWSTIWRPPIYTLAPVAAPTLDALRP